MSEQAAPGHGGRVCEYGKEDGIWLGFLRSDLKFDDPHWFYHGGWVLRCPACGVELKPDPEPLPVPLGCDKVRSYQPSTGGLWRVEGMAPGGVIRAVCDLNQQAAEAAWRRAFPKEIK